MCVPSQCKFNVHQKIFLRSLEMLGHVKWFLGICTRKGSSDEIG